MIAQVLGGKLSTYALYYNIYFGEPLFPLLLACTATVSSGDCIEISTQINYLPPKVIITESMDTNMFVRPTVWARRHTLCTPSNIWEPKVNIGVIVWIVFLAFGWCVQA